MRCVCAHCRHGKTFSPSFYSKRIEGNEQRQKRERKRGGVWRIEVINIFFFLWWVSYSGEGDTSSTRWRLTWKTNRTKFFFALACADDLFVHDEILLSLLLFFFFFFFFCLSVCCWWGWRDVLCCVLFDYSCISLETSVSQSVIDWLIRSNNEYSNERTSR